MSIYIGDVRISFAHDLFARSAGLEWPTEVASR